jgi:hypothetical protein
MIRMVSSRSGSSPGVTPPTLADGRPQPPRSRRALGFDPESGTPRGPLAGGCRQTYSVRPPEPAARPHPTEGGIRGERPIAPIFAGASIVAGGAGTVAVPFSNLPSPCALDPRRTPERAADKEVRTQTWVSPRSPPELQRDSERRSNPDIPDPGFATDRAGVTGSNRVTRRGSNQVRPIRSPAIAYQCLELTRGTPLHYQRPQCDRTWTVRANCG